MTLGLNYLDDLSRVQVSITDLPFDSGTARIERSTNQLYWQTVRGATALPVVGGAAVVDDYEFTADVENFYRRSAGVLSLPGAPGSFASAPVDAGMQVSGDITISADIAPDTWANGDFQYLVSRYDTVGANRSWSLRIGATGYLDAVISPNGTAVSAAESTVPIPAADGERLAVRVHVDVDNGAGGHTFTFWTAPTISGPWTQLGDPVTSSGATSIYAGSADLTISGRNQGTISPFGGRVFAVEVEDDGTRVVGVYFEAFAPGDAVVDAEGRPWRLHGDAELAGEAFPPVSITPSLDGKAWLKSIRHPFLNRPIHRALAGGGQSIGRASRGSVFEVQGRSVPVAVTDIRSSREFTLTVQVPNEAAARDMDLTLASGDVFFIQVPPELAPHMTGGYVRIGESTQHREADTIMWRFTIPCTVVAPPGPGVVGTTMTWGGVFRLYGSWEALVASNPTWGDLLATVGSPDDLVVL